MLIIKIARKIPFLYLALICLTLFFASIYGFFVDELNLGFDFISITGWKKNVLCLIGLLPQVVFSLYPVISGLSKALNHQKRGNSTQD